MKIKWTSKAVSDLNRLYQFLSRVNPDSAQQTLRSLSRGPDHLITNPRLGEQLFQFKDREVRKIHIGSYEMRYEVQKETIFILRVWHTREER